MRHTLITLLLALSLPQTIAAQGEGMFKNYLQYQREIFTSLRRSGDISTFNPVSALRRQGLTVKENTPVQLKAAKKNKKQLTGPQIAERTAQSTLMMCMYSFDQARQQNNMLIGATAVVLSEDGVCMTNYHILRPFIDRGMRTSPADSVFFVATQDLKLYQIKEILSYNERADMAFFRIDTRGDRLTPAPLGDDLPQGAQVHTMTHPDSRYYYYTQGVVARHIGVDPRDPFANRTEITAPYAKGSSGGGIYDDCANLIGMVSNTFSIYYTEEPQQNLQMVVKSIIPVSSIKRLVKY